MSARRLGYLESLDRLPPCLCRLIARVYRRSEKPLRPLSYQDIAQRSGLTWEKVVRIARLKTWANVTVAETEAFRRGCGITHLNEWRHIEYFKRTYNPAVTKKPLRHLDRLNERQQKRLFRLLGGQ